MVASGLVRVDTVGQALQWLQASGARRLVVDSRQVKPGDAFVAWPGAAHDARRFVAQALAAGACACLVAGEGVEAFAFEDERVAAMPRLKQHLGALCSAFYGQPSAEMEVMAVTGTNGKTSSAWWWAQASALLGERSAMAGTLGIGEPPVGGRRGAWTNTGLTTPDPAALHGALAAFLRDGVRRCAIEASSIGIVEHRLDALSIKVALFTNFTQDHLDYHQTLQHYWAAKRQLFDWPNLMAAVVNVDDPQGLRLHAELGGRRPDLDLWSVGFSPAARLNAQQVQSTATGTRFELHERGMSPAQVEVPFLGQYNVSNLLGVVAGLRAMGHAMKDVIAVLPQLTPVAGRLQAQGGAGEPLVVVDYAHTPDALEKALKALQPVASQRGGRLWCVFGCGGDRDRSKRPVMGAVAQREADVVVLASDNPRSEAPLEILDEIRAGLLGQTDVEMRADRREAIFSVLGQAAIRDVVLVAGKGHEDHQEIQGVRHPFSDVEVAGEALRARRSQGFFTLGDAVALVGDGARLSGDPRTVIGRVHTDTRTLQDGDLYVALRGERFDGHAFLNQARQGGAVAALAEQGLAAAGLAGIEVQDSLTGLQALARGWRAQLALPVIAVAGSNGKTTVTQMTASILRAWCGDRAGYTRGNLNNHIGVPLSVLSLRAGAERGHQAAVLELGMNHPGEVALLAGIAQPTVAVVNNAQREHQEFMHTVEAVARENGSVLNSLPAHGVAVFPADDAYADLWAQMAGHARVWRFSFVVVDAPPPFEDGGARTESPSSALTGCPALELRGRAYWAGTQWDLHLHTPQGDLNTTLHVPGRHNVHNAMAAAAAALAAGAPLQAVAQGLRVFQAVNGRSRLMTLTRQGQSVALIDDTYNANPDSVRAAIEVLAESSGPRALILGDMGEVGEQGPAFHAEVGRYARERGLEQLWTVGALCAHAAAAYGAQARHFETVESLLEALTSLADVRSILVKGSRFMRMERVVKALQPSTTEAG